MMMFIVFLIILSIKYANSFHSINNYYCSKVCNYMKRMIGDNDNDNNIKYIHKPTIVKDNDPLILIDYVMNVFPEVKRTQAKQWLSYKSILVNNEPQSQYNLELYPGDVISVRAGKIKTTSGSSGRFSTLPANLKVVFEDSSLLIIDKPAGMKVISTKESSASVMNCINKIISKRNEKIYLISHLDDQASGLLVFTKSPEMKTILLKNWKDAGKLFVCICHDSFSSPQGIIKTDMNIDKNSDNNKTTSIAVSNYRTIQASSTSSYSLVEFSLVTNYRDQLRFQLACYGNAIVGDNLFISERYNSKYENFVIRDPLRRLAMHCTELKFIHPLSKETMTFTSDIPRSFKELLGSHNNLDDKIITDDNNINNNYDSDLDDLPRDRNVKILSLEDFLGTSSSSTLKLKKKKLSKEYIKSNNI